MTTPSEEGFFLVLQDKPTRPEFYAVYVSASGQRVTGYGVDVYECLANAAGRARSEAWSQK